MGHLPQNINLPIAQRSELTNTGGIVAGFTGTANDAVLLFATPFTPQQGPPSYIVETNDAAAGTSVSINEPGVYAVELYIEPAGANTVHFGISQDVAAAGLTTDPDFATAGFLAVGHAVSLAAAVLPALLQTTVMVSPEQSIAGSVIRFHATDGGDAAPGAGSIIVASCYYRIRKINQLHS